MDTVVVEGSCKFNVKAGFQNFIYSFYFPLAVAFFTVFIYFTKMQLAGCFTFTLFAMIIFITQKDLTPILPPLFNVVFLFSDLSVFGNPLSVILFVPMVIGIIVHVIKYPPKKFKFGLYGISLAVIFLSLALGGLCTGKYLSYFSASNVNLGEGLSLILGIGLGMIVEYLIFANGISLEERKKFDFKVYISYAVLFSALTVALQLVIMRLLGYPRDFGWGNINFCGYVFMLAIPFALYLLVKTNNVFTYLAIICCLYVATYISGSDGALGTIVVFAPVMIIYAYTKLKKDKKMFFVNTCCLIILAVIIAITVSLITNGNTLAFIQKHFFNDTGRTPLFKLALKEFAENPVFGKGIFYPIINSSDLANAINGNHWGIVTYHSSIFNTLATTGIVGMSAILFNYFARFKILTKHNCLFNCCAYFAIAMYSVYSSIDNGEVIMLLILVTGIMASVEKSNEIKKPSYSVLLNK